MTEYRQSGHAVFDLKYHVIWCTKYRYKILPGRVAERARDLIRQICHARNVVIVRGAASPDHIYLLLSAPPILSPSKPAQYIKGRSSRLLQPEFPELRKRYWGQHMSARGYFCATVVKSQAYGRREGTPAARVSRLTKSGRRPEGNVAAPVALETPDGASEAAPATNRKQPIRRWGVQGKAAPIGAAAQVSPVALSAMTSTVKHPQIVAPRPDCVAILVGHHARYLMDMSEVVNGPCRHEFRQRHHPQRWMLSSPRPVFGLQIQRLQGSQILPSQAGEIVQELVERLALTLFELRKAVKGIKLPRFAFLQDDPQPRYPVRALPDDQVSHNVERAPGFSSFVAAHPHVG
jgi:putative transposase